MLDTYYGILRDGGFSQGDIERRVIELWYRVYRFKDWLNIYQPFNSEAN